MGKRLILAVSFVCVAATISQGGTVIGTQAIADAGNTTANDANLSTATVFTFGQLRSSTTNTEDFATYGLGGMLLASTSLDINNPTTFSFGSAVFGTFTATSIAPLVSGMGTASFLLHGSFSPGTAFPVDKRDPVASLLTIGFTQAKPGGAYSVSETLAAMHQPEPLTSAGALIGAACLAAARWRRHRRLTAEV
jgi:hypothetical protein